jgi:HPt (histidine-containing phosphotransfer) domain-containing protein
MSAVDFAYLENFAAHDAEVVRDVLTLFLQQADIWRARLGGGDAELRDLAHTIKGAARGIGARDLGDVCELAEFGGPQQIPALRAALDEAVAEIVAYQAAHA